LIFLCGIPARSPAIAEVGGLQLILSIHSHSLRGNIVNPIDPQTTELLEGMVNFIRMAEDERKLLASELHDQYLGDIYEISIIAERMHAMVVRLALPAPLQQDLEKMLERLKALSNWARQAMEDLRPSMLESLGFYPSLKSRLAQGASIARPSFTPHTQFLVKEEELGLSEEQMLGVYRILQEGIRNICKHAGARMVKLCSERRNGLLYFTLSDDGKGPLGIWNKLSGRGIDTMRFRARSLGAEIQWIQNDFGGTTVEIKI
jgi:signal transduction histidine kinase